IPVGRDRVIEHSFTENLPLEDAKIGMGIEKKAFHCQSCGASTLVDPQTITFCCEFCGSEQVNEEATEQRIISPFGLLPFSVPKEKALEIYREWIGNGWFRPGDLGKLAELDKIQGVYIPFWTYDADTYSSWWAEAGYYYYETEYYTDEHGNQQTRQVQRIRWVPVDGYYEHWFDDVTVIASKGITQNRIQEVYPFDLDKIVNYDPKFLAGWKSELYAIDVKDGFQIAEKIMDDYIYQECAKQIPGDTYRNLTVQTEKQNITFKHILLPIWIAAYRYEGKVYQVVINGRSGKISGSKPWSIFKIALAVIAFLILLFILWKLFMAKH
ncbi:MAG: zinc ribbon domain-containing protein, partial [Bacteroidia bacterium]|nr:zinc ribbon domain-containing protein [Bacteroidia bacterium]